MAESGLIIVDKPSGMTSHDVVGRMRRLVGTRRVGHAGTLDPTATGVLVIGVEKGTRLLGHLMLTTKVYEATIRLGQSTSTDDAEGEPTGGSPPSGVARETLEEQIAKLTGEIMQVPPGISAIKVNGQRAYKLTRAGAAPELAARPVTVHEFVITGVRSVRGLACPGAGGAPATTEGAGFLDVDATVTCSSGTYIRALARDLGEALGTGGHLTALRRTAVGPYDLSASRTLEELAERTVVTPLEQAAAAAFPRVDLTGQDAKRLAHGMRVTAPPAVAAPPVVAAPPTSAASPSPVSADMPMAAFAPNGTLIALVTVDSDRLRPLAVFAA